MAPLPACHPGRSGHHQEKNDLCAAGAGAESIESLDFRDNFATAAFPERFSKIHSI
jgi:hypothetical protein